MNVTDLSEWRAASESGTPLATCACGSTWFELEDGAVVMTEEGSITGYTGRPRCAECGAYR